jgi:hypothetical protein
MKGTLFSADFIKDADANLRLLELNTDSGFITNTLSNRFDFAAFISILNSNSITELVVVYKAMQTNFVDLLKTTIATDATFITTVTEQIEAVDAIYPEAVTDSSEKFILRLAYDENALLDSTYCKQRANVQKLFYDNSATGSIPEVYYSGSDYVINTLTSDINDHESLPDFVIKPTGELHAPLHFFNIGGFESSSADRTSTLISEMNTWGHMVEKYHYNEEEVTEDGKVSGYRVVGIVYGSDIEYVTLGEWRVKSFLDIPSRGEIRYILNNEGLYTVLEDFEGTIHVPGVNEHIPYTSLASHGGMGRPTVVSEPDVVGTASNVMKVVTDSVGDGWQNAEVVFNQTSVDLTTDNKVITVDVYSDVATSILAKVASALNGSADRDTDASHGGTGWETLSFDFNDPKDNPSDVDDVFSRILFFPLWNGTDFDDASVITLYLNNITGLEYRAEASDFLNTYQYKHYFQLTSNWIRTTSHDAVYVDTDVLNLDNTSVGIATLEADDVVKSIFINGLPDGDIASMYESWSSSGKAFPAGSFVTSSVVENLFEVTNDRAYGIVGEIKISEEEAIYTSAGKHFLAYSTGSNAMSFKSQYILDPTDDFLVDPSGSLIPIISNKVVILEHNETGSLYQLDVETTDTYFISSSTAPFIVHNAPCFVAGTKIHTENGIKNIEDVKVGEMVMTFNHDNDTSEYKEVLEVMFKENESVITYVFEDETELTGTKDHPLYVVGKGYASFEPQQTLDDSGLNVEQIKVGDEVLHLDIDGVTITEIKEAGFEDVYNLKNVQDNHNFYANDLLVHNRYCCFLAGTEISLSNGDVKNIEDVIVGDVVKSYIESIHKNETIGRYESGIVTAIDHEYNVGSHASACNSLGDAAGVYSLNKGELMFTPEHPFLTKRGWASLVPISTQEPYLSQQDEELILSIGDFIIEDGKWVEIKTIEHHPMDVDTPVYNITVDVHHNYIANNIVVHNK